MKNPLLLAGAVLAFGVLRTGGAPPAASAPTAGLVPNQPALWSRFDGDARNDGIGKAQWVLQNTAFQSNTLYLNGKYRALAEENGDGFRALCQLEKFGKDRFTVALRFKRDPSESGRNIVTAGMANRWFGISLDLSNHLEITFNNGQVARPITGVDLRADGWNWLVCSVDVPAKKCVALLNGMMAGPIALPPDFELVVRQPAERTDNVWTFTNYADTRCFSGWVDEFLFYDRELTGIELAGLAHRREMLEPKLPALTKPPALANGTPANGRPPLLEKALASNPAERVERPGTLAISTVGSGNSIAARLTGTYSWNTSHVIVKMKQAEIVRTNNGGFPERKVLGFHLFLARTNPALQYLDKVGRSETVAVDTVIGHGQSVLLDDVDVEIPVRGIAPADLAKMWLGVWIDEAHVGAAAGAPKAGVCVALSSTCLNGEPRPVDPPPSKPGTAPTASATPVPQAQPNKLVSGQR